jgi:hypothetical protein
MAKSALTEMLVGGAEIAIDAIGHSLREKRKKKEEI